MSKRKYIARLTTEQLTHTVEMYLEDKNIVIISYSRLLNLIIVESDIDLLDQEIEYLADIEEDSDIMKT